jgi:hypothetical protein
MRSIVAVMMMVAVLATSGCWADAVRANKGQSPQYYTKAGATWESREADWQDCGGRPSNWLIVWNPVWDDVGDTRNCMVQRGYSQNTTAGEPDSTPTKPAR